MFYFLILIVMIIIFVIIFLYKENKGVTYRIKELDEWFYPQVRFGMFKDWYDLVERDRSISVQDGGNKGVYDGKANTIISKYESERKKYINKGKSFYRMVKP